MQISANKFARIVQVVCQVLQHGRAPGETRLLHPPAGSQEPDRVSRTLLEFRGGGGGGGCVQAVPGGNHICTHHGQGLGQHIL